MLIFLAILLILFLFLRAVIPGVAQQAARKQLAQADALEKLRAKKALKALKQSPSK